jgi:hypothetical protein
MEDDPPSGGEDDGLGSARDRADRRGRSIAVERRGEELPGPVTPEAVAEACFASELIRKEKDGWFIDAAEPSSIGSALPSIGTLWSSAKPAGSWSR